jgi:acyl-CoA reductase-like NAD-dependent aldehyde dehydrogenase
MRAAVDKIGDPLDKATVMGPLVNKTALERVSKMIERGKNEAELVVGGVRHGEQGCFVEPTVFLNPQKGAQIYSDEIFGPVAVVKTFETEEEVLKMANDTEYGLMSGVFTKDINRAMRVSAKLESGVVGVNCVSYVSVLMEVQFLFLSVLSRAVLIPIPSKMNVQVPFGGKKQSGLGREYGEYVRAIILIISTHLTDRSGLASIYRTENSTYQVSLLFSLQ